MDSIDKILDDIRHLNAKTLMCLERMEIRFHEHEIKCDKCKQKPEEKESKDE